MIDNNNSAEKEKIGAALNPNTNNNQNLNSNFTKLLEITQNLHLEINSTISTDHVNLNFSSKNSSEVFDLIRDCLYYNTINFADNLTLVKEYLNLLINSFAKISNENSKMEILEFFEKLIYLFLFYYQLEIVHMGLKILNLMILETDYEFQKETLQKFIKILHIAKVKKSVSTLVCNKIIFNISQGIMLIIYKTCYSEVKKVLLDFISNNYEDHIFMWVLLANCNNELNLSKFYAPDTICNMVEKNCKELDKQNSVLEKSILNIKTEKSLALKNKIKQTVDIIACICKVIDSFNLRTVKTYNYDKKVKEVLIPHLKKFWNLILFNQESFFYEIDFSVESILTVMNLSDNINTLNFEILLPLLNCVSLFLEKNLKYIILIRSVVKFLSKCEVPNETRSEIISATLEIIERILTSASQNFPQVNKDAIFKYYIVLILDSLENFPNNPQLIIREDLKLCQILYSSIKEGKISENENQDIQNEANNQPIQSIEFKPSSQVESKPFKSLSNFEIFLKEFKTLTLLPPDPSKNNGGFRKPNINGLKSKNNPNLSNPFFKSLNQSLKKYEEFKNSLKTAYNLDCYDLIVDNKIINFKDNEKLQNSETNITEISQMYENFYLESTIEMYREIFNKK